MIQNETAMLHRWDAIKTIFIKLYGNLEAIKRRKPSGANMQYYVRQKLLTFGQFDILRLLH
jgi:hypothetical protein